MASCASQEIDGVPVKAITLNCWAFESNLKSFICYFASGWEWLLEFQMLSGVMAFQTNYAFFDNTKAWWLFKQTSSFHQWQRNFFFFYLACLCLYSICIETYRINLSWTLARQKPYTQFNIPYSQTVNFPLPLLFLFLLKNTQMVTIYLRSLGIQPVHSDWQLDVHYCRNILKTIKK